MQYVIRTSHDGPALAWFGSADYAKAVKWLAKYIRENPSSQARIFQHNSKRDLFGDES